MDFLNYYPSASYVIEFTLFVLWKLFSILIILGTLILWFNLAQCLIYIVYMKITKQEIDYNHLKELTKLIF